jgi:folate-binding protein YgfZ
MSSYRSPLLDWPGAVQAAGPDSATAWHYGDPLGEQRRARSGCALFDQSHRDVLVVAGPDRLEWLHAICSQHVSDLTPGQSTEALVLSMNGHVEQHWNLTELADQVWIDTEPGAADEAQAYLLKMRFLKRVEPAVVTADWALLSLVGPATEDVLAAAGFTFANGAAPAVQIDGGGFIRRRADAGADLMLARPALLGVAQRLRAAGAIPMGSWAAAALRVEQRRPRLGFDTDHRTLVQEAGWIPTAVHLDKGCYRGQETVARVQNLGKAPRRLVLLHLSGDSDVLPAPGTPVERDGRTVGVLGTAVHHHELGPIALALIKRNIEPGETLSVAGDPVAIDRSDVVGRQLVSGFAGHAGPASTSA